MPGTTSQLNPFFPKDGFEGEQQLQTDLIREAITIHGHDFYYIPREIVTESELLNEDLSAKFVDKYLIEAYISSIDNFDGDGALIAKFGFEVRNRIRIVISRERWNELVPALGFDRPREGDLVYSKMFQSLFEVQPFVQGANIFYQFGHLPIFELSLEVFEYSNQKIKTGNEEIDSFEKKFGNTLFINDYTYNNADEFAAGEEIAILLPTGITGDTEILEINDGVLILRTPLFNDERQHKIVSGTILTSPTGAEATVNSDAAYTDDEKNKAQNKVIQNSDSGLNWDKNNPLGNFG